MAKQFKDTALIELARRSREGKPDHQSYSPHIPDDRVLLLELAQALHEIAALFRSLFPGLSALHWRGWQQAVFPRG